MPFQSPTMTKVFTDARAGSSPATQTVFFYIGDDLATPAVGSGLWLSSTKWYMGRSDAANSEADL